MENKLKIKNLVLTVVLSLGLVACGGSITESEPPAPAENTTSSGSGVFKSNTRLMTADEAANSILTADTLTVKKPQPSTYAVGTVVVVDGHGGRLIKITSVAESSDSTTYGYVQASLAQAFEKLDVAFQGALTQEDLGSQFVTNDPELEINWLAAPATALKQSTLKKATTTDTLEIKFKRFGAQTGSGIEFDGNANFVLNPDFSLKLDPPQGAALPDLSMSALLSPELKTSISLASLYGGQISYTVDKSYPLKPFKRIILVPILGVPVPVPFWVTPVITISGGVNGTAGSKFTTTYNYGVSGKFGFTKAPGAGFEAVSQLSNSSTINVSDVESEFGVNIAAPKFEMQFLIYSVAGPNFDLGFESGVTGKSVTQGTPPVEGLQADGSVKVKANVGLKAGTDQLGAVKSLLGDVSFSYSPISFAVVDFPIFSNSWFFPYKGVAAVTVRDNGSVPDDIFEVSLDGVVVGRTNKGGSGQFRLKNLRPGTRALTVKTVEDDSPPGTYEISLADGLTFSIGGTLVSGFANLGQTVSYDIVVPAPAVP